MEEPNEKKAAQISDMVAARARSMSVGAQGVVAGRAWKENAKVIEAVAARAGEVEQRAAAPVEVPEARPVEGVAARPQDNMIQLDELEMAKIELLASKRQAISLEEQLLAVRMRELRQNKERLLISEATLLKQIGMKFGFEDVQAIRLVDQARGLCVVDGKKDVPTKESEPL